MSVGIAITGFGCGSYLAEAMDSVAAQSDRDWSCAVIYDPIEHDAVVRSMAATDPRFIPIPSDWVCVSAARNRALADVEGDLLIALDGDDLLAPDYVNVLRKAMENPLVRIAYASTWLFGTVEGYKQEVPYSPRMLAIRNMIVSSAMFRRKDLLSVGGYDPDPRNLYEDWELWVSIMKMGGDVHFAPQTLLKYRQRPESRWHSMSIEQHRSAREYIFEKHPEFCWHTPPGRPKPRNSASC